MKLRNLLIVGVMLTMILAACGTTDDATDDTVADTTTTVPETTTTVAETTTTTEAMAEVGSAELPDQGAVRTIGVRRRNHCGWRPTRSSVV